MYTVFVIRPDGHRYSFQATLTGHPSRGQTFAILGGFWGVVLRVKKDKVLILEK